MLDSVSFFKKYDFSKGVVIRINPLSIHPNLWQEKQAILNDFLDQHTSFLQVLTETSVLGKLVYFKENKASIITPILLKIKFLFGLSLDDSNSFLTSYNLPKDLDKLKNLFFTQFSLSQKKQLHPKDVSFTPQILATLTRNLIQADISPLMRHQSVCACIKEKAPVELFEEIYVSLSDLQKALCPNADFETSPWLEDTLFEVLDKRVLEAISRHDNGAFLRDFSLNLSVATLLSPEFESFSRTFSSTTKHSILLEVKLSDILTNLSSFLEIKNKILKQGYRLSIDLVSPQALQFIPKQKFDASFIKLIWTEKLFQNFTQKEFIHNIQRLNPASFILCHVDDKRALPLAQEVGIFLYQGYLIQKRLYKNK